MNIKKYFICIFGGSMLLLAGCKKELDQQPPDAFGDANAFRDLKDIQLGVNGAYSRTAAVANDIYVNTLLADESKIGQNNAGQGALTFRLQFGADGTSGGDVTAAYAGYYALIDQVNRVLFQIDKVLILPGEETRKNVVKGQLLALRGIAHLALLQSYADRYGSSNPGVPIMVEYCVTCKPARNTMGEVVAQIEKDFSDARSLMPAATFSSFSDTVMNSINIAAFQARTSLFKGDYNQAITYASQVIGSGIRPLASGSTYSDIWQDKSSAEILFKRLYVTSTGIGGLWTTTAASFNVYLAPSDKLVASYGVGDIRKATFIGANSDGPYVNKFYSSDRGGRIVDAKVIRMSEMYLIRAEAYAKTGNVSAGAADLNQLRSNRITGYANETFASGDALFTAVMDERFKELCFEGFRFFDLKRANLPLQRAATDASPEWQSLPANSFRWTLPIPRQETISNPNTVQNPGYN